jgi:hypothetical protein
MRSKLLLYYLYGSELVLGKDCTWQVEVKRQAHPHRYYISTSGQEPFEIDIRNHFLCSKSISEWCTSVRLEVLLTLIHPLSPEPSPDKVITPRNPSYHFLSPLIRHSRIDGGMG